MLYKDILRLLIVSCIVILGIELGYADSINNTNFVTTWKTDNTGTSCSSCITIPTLAGGYNYDIDTNNDGNFDVLGLTGSYTHNFGSPGTYTVRIRGSFPRMYFNNTGDKNKILSVDQWGNNIWAGMNNMFHGAANLTIPASDVPNLTGIVNMNSMFNGASSLNQSLNNWNVSNVTSMSSMFQGASSFNQPLNGWDTSKVTNTSFMFRSASNFNQSLSGWDTSKITNMASMFQSASNFNQPLNGWNTSNVLDMSAMFALATTFNQSLSGWDTSKVVNMSSIFQSASNFNQPLSSWDTSKVTNMTNMFRSASNFNQPLSSWDTSKVTNMNSMFNGASSFNQSLNNWNISNVTNMNNMLFSTALSLEKYDSTLSGWSNQILLSGIVLGAGGLKYCESLLERQYIISNYGWTIQDAGNGCPGPVIAITAPTKLSSGSITDTIIHIEETYGNLQLTTTGITLLSETTAAISNFLCTQITPTEVECTLSVNTSGNIVIHANNTKGGVSTGAELNYIVDTLPPYLPSLYITTEHPYTVNNPQIGFSSNDNVALDYCTISYLQDDDISGTTGTIFTTISPVTSPIYLNFDPDDVPTHQVSVTCYDTVGNSSTNTVDFPLLIEFATPTIISNTGIVDASVTIVSVGGNDIDDVSILSSNIAPLPTLVNCIGSGGDTIAPYTSPVTCNISSIEMSGILSVGARDTITNAGIQSNSVSFIVDKIVPITTIIAPTLVNNTGIINTTISITDDTMIFSTGVMINSGSSIVYSNFHCSQINNSQVDCSIQINDDGDLLIDARDVAGNIFTAVQTGYVVDNIVPSISILQPLSGSEIVISSLYSGLLFTGEDDMGAVTYKCQINLGSWFTCTSPYSLENLSQGTYVIRVQSFDMLGNQSNIATTTFQILPTFAGGGGGHSISIDYCPHGDYSASYYDGDCDLISQITSSGEDLSTEDNLNLTDNIFNPIFTKSCFNPLVKRTFYQGNDVSQLFRKAHQLLYTYGLTIWKGTEDYKPYDYLTREEAAKFMVEFAQNILCRTKIKSYTNEFVDIDTSNPILKKFVIESYEYGIFKGYKNGIFKPKDHINIDELVAIIVRLITNNTLDEPKNDWSLNYRLTLGKYSKLNQFIGNIKRGLVAELLYDLYKNNDYEWKEVGYVIK